MGDPVNFPVDPKAAGMENPDPAPYRYLTAVFARTTFTNHLRSHFKHG